MSIDQGERALATFGLIEDERGGETRFERITFDEQYFFLREAIDNKGGEITHDMAWSIADEVAEEVRDKGQSLSTHFYSYDRKEGVWNVYRFEVNKEKPGFIFEYIGLEPQCVLENKYKFSLLRTEREFVEQSINDLRHMNSRLPADRELIEQGLASKDLQTRIKADIAHDMLTEKEAIQKETKANLERYLTLRGEHAQTQAKASTIEKQMRETMEGRFQDAKEKERERTR